MAKVIKKRPDKKKAVQEDEVKSAALQSLERAKEYQKQLIIGGVGIAAVIIIYLVASLYSSSVAGEAYELELEANNLFYGTNTAESMTEEDRWKKAMELYKKSVDLKATPSALYYLGNCNFNLGDYENAVNSYRDFLDKFSGEKGITPLVYQKLASSYFKSSQPDKALETLGELAKFNNGIFKDTALVFKARHYESAGDSEKALKLYREIIAGFPTSPWMPEATSRVSVDEAKEEAEASDSSKEETAEKKAEKPSEPDKTVETAKEQ